MTKNCIVDLIADFYEYKKKTNQVANFMLDSELLKIRGQKMLDCGTTIGLSENENSDGYKVTAANFCRQRLCPNCQRRRSLKTYACMSEVYQLATKQGFAFLHIVLTLPNCAGSDLNKTIDFLYKKSSLLFRKSDDIHTRAACNSIPGAKELRQKIAKSFRGVFRALEVTRNESVDIENENAFHPHLHCLVAVRKSYFTSRDYVKYDDLRTVWSALTGVKNVQVFMGKVTDNCAAIAEVAKYAVKPFTDNIDIETIEVLHKALFNRRLTQNYGIFKDWFSAIGIDDLEEVVDENNPMSVSVWLFYEGDSFTIEGI